MGLGLARSNISKYNESRRVLVQPSDHEILQYSEITLNRRRDIVIGTIPGFTQLFPLILSSLFANNNT